MIKIDKIIDELFETISFDSEPQGLYEPLKYMVQIGGKRVRPRLCLLAYSLFKDEINEEILSPAAAIEVFHSFTLMHDDIMDRSDLRRGKPTVWKKWNESTAVLSGDVMLIDSFRRVAKAPKAVATQVMSLFSQTAVDVCEGQQYDMDFESAKEVSMEEYNKMIGLKTAVLIACSAKMGALIAGASEKKAQALYNYGYELGMAFQVEDDYLDAFGDVKIFGKPIGGDILNCKKSWLTVRTMQKVEDKQGFLELFNIRPHTEEQRKAKIKAIKDIYIANGIDKDAREQISIFSSRAMQALEEAKLGAVKIEQLRRFADNLIARTQ